MFETTRRVAPGLAIALALVATPAHAELAIVDNFELIGGVKRGLAFAPLTNTIWTYRTFGQTIDEHTESGGPLGSLTIDGADNTSSAALDITTAEFVLNGTTIPVGTLLYFEGSRGALDVYAYDPDFDVLIASLATSFGMDNITGGALHPQRGTLFAVHSEGGNGASWFNIVAEIDPADGAILNSYTTQEVLAGYDVQQGGLDVDANGRINVLSNSDTRLLVFEPDGTLVETIQLPPLMTPHVDLSLDDPSGDVWISSSNIIYRLRDDPNDSDADGIADAVDNCIDAANPGQVDADNDGYGNACDGDFNNDCVVAAIDLGLLKLAFFSADAVIDLNADGIVNAQDLGIFKGLFFLPPGPSGLTDACS